MKNQNKYFDIDNYGEAYNEGRLEARRIEKTIETEKKLLPIFNMGTIRNNFNSLSGRDHRIAIINSHIHNFSVAQDEIWNLGSGLVKKETSWALMGGIASGLAGGAAGLAVATDVQRRNAQIRADNAELMQKRARYIALSAPQLGTMEEEKKRLQALLKKAENSLVEDAQSDLYFNKLNINEPSIFLFSDNRYVIFADFSKEDIIIYGDIKAEIEGIISAEIYDGDKKVATVDAALPIFNAKNGFNNNKFDNNKVSYDEITYSEQYARTIICSGVFKHEFNNKPVVKFVNKKLWAIEKIKNHTETESIKYAQNSDILTYVRENNDYIAFATIQKKDKLLKQAEKLIKSANTVETDYSKLDCYTKAVDILKTISNWKNSDELLKNCEQKVIEISNIIRANKERADKKTKTIVLSVVSVVVLIAFVIMKFIIPSVSSNSASKSFAEENYKTAYELIPEADGFEAVKISVNGVTEMYKATNGTGYVIAAQGDGYGGNDSVKIAVAYNNDGNITNIKIRDCRSETRGYDKIKNETWFVNQFIGIKGKAKTGENVDTITGATISSSAVIDAVNAAAAAFSSVKG